MSRINSKGKKEFYGYCIDMLKMGAELKDFHYHIYQVPDHQEGHMNEQGEWNGMVKELMDKVRFSAPTVC